MSKADPMKDAQPAAVLEPNAEQKFRQQELQYAFPYHYLPDVRDGVPTISQRLNWGLEYITYMKFVSDLIADELKPRRLIDVGCGDGRLVHMLTGRVDELVGADPAPQAIAFARAFNPNAVFYEQPVQDVPGQFEVATLVEVMEHIEDSLMPTILGGVHEKLVDGGYLVATVPTTNMPLHKKHFRHYTLELMTSQLTPLFEIEKHWFVVHESPLYRMIDCCLANRLFELRPRSLRRRLWRIHEKHTTIAKPHTGKHLVVMARKV